MRTLRYLVLVVSTLLPVAAQDSSPRKLITSVEGKDLFVAYCASCHGMAGRGDGPVSSALKTKIPDLATLAARRQVPGGRSREDDYERDGQPGATRDAGDARVGAGLPAGGGR